LKAVKGPVIWIGGGVSKNTNIANFAESLAPLVDWVVVYGGIGEALNEAFLKIGKECSYYPQLDEAIQAGLRLSNGQNEVSVLFSPGFASFGQFNSYSDRGKFFQKTIFSLLKG
jgi:UDP-N-acetylmuramoylalanine-D-glutamate ligase